jgi:hypothetical protein
MSRSRVVRGSCLHALTVPARGFAAAPGRAVCSVRSVSLWLIPSLPSVDSCKLGRSRHLLPGGRSIFRRLFFVLAALLLSAGSAAAQQASQEPLTFWYDYTVRPGREADFLDLVKTVGQPVRDKLMADGVVLAWGLEVPVLRVPGYATHVIWYVVADMAGVEKVQDAMTAQLAKIAADESAQKMQKELTTAARMLEVIDVSKTRDWLTRDIIVNHGKNPIPAGTLPYTAYSAIKARPGKSGGYVTAWQTYNKPVYDKLVADGVVLEYGLAVEAVKTSDDFTHFLWVVTWDLAARDKVRAALQASQEKMSEADRDSMAEVFADAADAGTGRQMLTRSLIFKTSGH